MKKSILFQFILWICLGGVYAQQEKRICIYNTSDQKIFVFNKNMAQPYNDFARVFVEFITRNKSEKIIICNSLKTKLGTFTIKKIDTSIVVYELKINRFKRWKLYPSSIEKLNADLLSKYNFPTMPYGASYVPTPPPPNPDIIYEIQYITDSVTGKIYPIPSVKSKK